MWGEYTKALTDIEVLLEDCLALSQLEGVEVGLHVGNLDVGLFGDELAHLSK